MLSLHKLSAGAEDYYMGQVAEGLEEYYTGAREAPGLWLGSACPDLGLEGEVANDDLRAVLGGLHPSDGSALSLRHVSPEHRVSGFDVTLSAPLRLVHRNGAYAELRIMPSDAQTGAEHQLIEVASRFRSA